MPVAARTLSQLTVLTQLTSLRGRVHANNIPGQWSRDFQYTTQVGMGTGLGVWRGEFTVYVGVGQGLMGFDGG